MGLARERRPAMARAGADGVDPLPGAITADNSHYPPGSPEVLLDAWRVVANAKLAAFRQQCWRLALLSQQGGVGTHAAVDRLWEIASAHALIRALGDDRVQAIISEAFHLSFEGDTA